MAISKKGKRKITVGKDVFYWISDFQTDILRLTVMTEEKSHSRLICDFEYKNFWYYFKEIVQGQDIKIPSWNLSPKIVRQVIDYAILNGWKPLENGKDFVIKDIESKINIKSKDSIVEVQTEIVSKVREWVTPNPQSPIQNPKSK